MLSVTFIKLVALSLLVSGCAAYISPLVDYIICRP